MYRKHDSKGCFSSQCNSTLKDKSFDRFEKVILLNFNPILIKKKRTSHKAPSVETLPKSPCEKLKGFQAPQLLVSNSWQGRGSSQTGISCSPNQEEMKEIHSRLLHRAGLPFHSFLFVWFFFPPTRKRVILNILNESWLKHVALSPRLVLCLQQALHKGQVIWGLSIFFRISCVPQPGTLGCSHFIP